MRDFTEAQGAARVVERASRIELHEALRKWFRAIRALGVMKEFSCSVKYGWNVIEHIKERSRQEELRTAASLLVNYVLAHPEEEPFIEWVSAPPDQYKLAAAKLPRELVAFRMPNDAVRASLQEAVMCCTQEWVLDHLLGSKAKPPFPEIPSNGPQRVRVTPIERKAEWEARALLLLRGDPNITGVKLAHAVGVAPSTISRSKVIKRTRHAATAGRSEGITTIGRDGAPFVEGIVAGSTGESELRGGRARRKHSHRG